MTTKQKNKMVLSLGVVVAVLVLIFVLEQVMPPTSMLFAVLQKGAIIALVAVSMNLLNGFTGLFSLGQAGFMLIGAYTYAVFTIPDAARASVYQYYNGGIIHFELPFVVALILAGLAAAAFAAVIGIPVLRLKSDYLAIATLGFAEIMRAIFQWDKLGPITNGSNILRKFPYFTTTLTPFIISGICIAIILLLINSSYGRAFKAIRDDEIAAEAMGINLFKHKLLSFVISSFFAGIGGAMLAMFQTTIIASTFKSSLTYEILLIMVIGSVSGSVIASFLYIACSEWWLRFLDEGSVFNITVPFFRVGFRKVVFAVIVMIIVLFFRKGIMGDKELSWDMIRSIPKKLFRRKKAAAEGGASDVE